MSEYSSDYGKEYDFTDYPATHECIECTRVEIVDDMVKCEDCEEWLCKAHDATRCLECRREAGNE